MCVTWLDELKRGPSVVPTKGALDDPTPAYPTSRTLGRSDHHPVLRDRRPLPNPQPTGRSLRFPQGALGLRGDHPRHLPAAEGRGVRALLLARGRPLFQPPLPEDRRPLSLLVPPKGTQAQASARTLETRHPDRVGGRSGDYDHRFQPARGSSHPRQVSQSPGFDGAASWVRWGTFSVYGVKLHMLCATNRVPISYELTAA